MSWQDRIAEAAYTSPSGERLVFSYENVSVAFDKKGATYDFPDADGTYVQDLGKSGRRYPLAVYFSGANCDLQADLFMAMLAESGEGKLEHPLYGIVTVTPFGEISRRDDLKTAANQSIIEVTFWETTGVVYPTSQRNSQSEVALALLAYNQAVAEQFADSVKLTTPSAKAGLVGDFNAAMAQARNKLSVVTEASAKVQRQFTAINRSIVEGLDDLVGDPLTLALQTALFIQSPGRSVARIGSRLDAYAALIDVLAGTNERPGFGPRNSNRFKAKDQFVSGAMSGQVVAVVNNTFDTKTAAVAAAGSLMDQLDVVTDWREANYESLGEIDTGKAYAALQAAVANAAGYLVEISFTLRQERSIFTDRARTIVDLVAELYGQVDEKLDFFIMSNKLTGSEILELPKGRKIVYYV